MIAARVRRTALQSLDVTIFADGHYCGVAHCDEIAIDHVAPAIRITCWLDGRVGIVATIPVDAVYIAPDVPRITGWGPNVAVYSATGREHYEYVPIGVVMYP